MNSTSINYFSDGQIVYVEDSGSLFKQQLLRSTLQTHLRILYPFQAFSFNSGSFVSASFDGTNTLTFFGEQVGWFYKNFNVS